MPDSLLGLRQNNAGKDILLFSRSPMVPKKRGCTEKWVLGLPLVPTTPPLAPTRCYAELKPPLLPLILSLSISLSPLPRSISPSILKLQRRGTRGGVSWLPPSNQISFWWKCLAAAKIRFSLWEGARAGGWSEAVQHGSAPVGRHDKSELCIMDESSILRRRGLQVGKQMSSCAVSLGWLCTLLYVCVVSEAPVLVCTAHG